MTSRLATALLLAHLALACGGEDAARSDDAARADRGGGERQGEGAARRPRAIPAAEAHVGLGYGVDTIRGAPMPRACINAGFARLDKVDTFYWGAHSFIASAPDQIEARLHQALLVREGADDRFVSTFEEALRAYYDQAGADREVLAVALKVKTMRRILDRDIVPHKGYGAPLDFRDSRCSPDAPALETLGEFVESCGEAFVRSETLGGYILLSADVTDLDGVRRAAIEESLRLERWHERPDSIAKMLEPLLTSGLAIGVDTYGLAAPRGPLDPEAWDAYVDELGRFREPLERGVVDDPSYGARLHWISEGYRFDTMRDCSADREAFNVPIKEWSCYRHFWEEDAQLQSRSASPLAEGARLRALRERAARLVRDPKSAIWASPIAESVRAYREALDFSKACERARDDQRATCQMAPYTGQLDELCARCETARACSYGELLDRFEELPPTTEKSAP